ncbi:kinase-like domain-containing protein [Phaeosphaeriaceae sp. PMI808]|nr:kinase-like domain-containing protein [Phaeosphaeriaceae sp. PMI808]
MSSVRNLKEQISWPGEPQGGCLPQGRDAIHLKLNIPYAIDMRHEGGNSNIQIDQRQSWTTTSTFSSSVEDTGDSLQLAATAAKQRIRPDQNELAQLGQLGSYPTTFDVNVQPIPSSHEIDEDDDPPTPLQHQIRGFMINTAGQEDSQFLPFSELESIITIRNIQKEIRRTDSTSNVDSVAHNVWDLKSLPNKEWTTRRKLFAILCLMEKAGEIERFIEEEIYDTDLPFEFEPAQVWSRSRTAIRLFKLWKLNDLDSFRAYQGQFMAPYFELCSGISTRFREYTLHRSIVLPFEDYRLSSIPFKNAIQGVDSNTYREGGYSTVRKVTIHPAHHNFLACSHSKTQSEKSYFAIKTIHKEEGAMDNHDEPFNRETTAYKRLNSIRHPHIVQLLATYYQKRHLNMIFHWADGDLYEFWQNSSSSLPRDQHLARWLIAQFLGLADALYCIHHSELMDPASHDLGPQDCKRTHGRHGDFKPHNILWFRSDSTTNRLGNLMVSDLGSTEFHATHSKTIAADMAGGFTDTYRAPEFDKFETVAPKADIWSFGCVLLEFIVWYILEWQGVMDFAGARKDDSNWMLRADHFFNYNQDNKEVEVKASVTQQVAMLMEAPGTSDFLVDLLDFVGNELLKTQPAKRATCSQIVSKFRAIKGRCDQDILYCTQRKLKKIARASTDLSEKALVSLSAEMHEEYVRVLVPNSNVRPSALTTKNSGLAGNNVQRTPKDRSDYTSNHHRAPSSTQSSGPVSWYNPSSRETCDLQLEGRKMKDVSKSKYRRASNWMRTHIKR